MDGYEMDYPGDPKAPGYLIYNCRCTIDSVDKFHDFKAPRVAENPMTRKPEQIPGMTYKEWEAMHKAQNPEAWDLCQKKSQNLSADKKQFAEYKAALGSSVPKSLDDFQKVKYTEPERWVELKTQKRQADFVNNAPCETPQKISEYFLNPEQKHSQEFFDVGYTKEDGLKLRYDIAKQFDVSKAVSREVMDNGVVRFNIYMNLGTQKTKCFRTCWRMDSESSVPRIITAFRENKNGK